MLSFDITDRNIRIIKGTESGNKIRISAAATLELDEELIVNGHVKDIPRVASLVNNILKTNKMADKDAIVSISSNLTIFKELQIEKAKEQEFAKNVKQQMHDALSIDDSYSVSYIIVGDTDKETAAGRENLVTVLATACPYEIIDCYKKVFQMLGISLKSVMIGCNCITKLLLADTKIKSKMPLLAVQIDRNFISLNLYEKGQLAFSRFASISAEDYDDSEDYVFEAVNENIFRMLQFQRSRNTGETVENIIFYGEIGDNAYYARLIDEMAKMELHGDTLTAPPQIHGYENLKFELYANAIGAMFKRNKETEKVNLLETDNINNNKIKSDSSYSYMLLGVTVACAAVVGIAWGVLTGINSGIRNDIDDLQAKITSPETNAQIQLHEKLTTMQTEVQTYLASITNLHDAMVSKPMVLGAHYDKLVEVLNETAEELNVTNANILSPQYDSGVFSFSVECDGTDEPSQKLPAQFVQNLLDDEDGYFEAVDYTSYNVTETVETVGGGAEGTPANTNTKHTVMFSLTATLKSDATLKGNPIFNPADVENESQEDAANTEGAE